MADSSPRASVRRQSNNEMVRWSRPPMPRLQRQAGGRSAVSGLTSKLVDILAG
jgi:hypothetical protein